MSGVHRAHENSARFAQIGHSMHDAVTDQQLDRRSPFATLHFRQYVRVWWGRLLQMVI